jgi:hypothetical protein
MNLLLAHKIIGEAEHQQSGLLEVCGHEAAREVHLMAEAGLVKAAESDELDPSEAVITMITHAGRQFYRALRHLGSYSNN